MDGSFNFLLFLSALRVKKQYDNPVPLEFFASSYVEVRAILRTSSYQKVKNIWKRDYIAFMH